MAFEAYLQQGTVRPSRARRLTAVISFIVHASAVLVAVAYSFWHVEELVPPAVTVTFMAAAAAPPPPPPPPPLGGGAGAAPKPRKTVHQKVEATVKPPELLAPKTEVLETPKPAPQEAPKPTPTEAVKAAGDNPGGGSGPGPGKAVGVPGGDAKGVKDGVLNGTGLAPTPAVKMLPPAIGSQQKISGADPEFPPSLRTAGANYLVMAKICVAASGTVDSVALLKRANPTLDNNVVVTVKNWRFRPLTANGVPVPFCYFGRFEFRSE